MLMIFVLSVLNFKERVVKTESDLSDALRLKARSVNILKDSEPTISEKHDDLDDMREKLGKSLGYPINSINGKFWRKIHSFIMNNWNEIVINGNFAISFEISYIYCVYVIAFIPGEVAFFIPAKYKYFIPKKSYKIQIVADILKEMDMFLGYIKVKSKKELLITFYVGRQKSLKEDFRMLLELPKVIIKDPVRAIRSLLAFKIWTDGYEEYKNRNNGGNK